MKVQCDVCGKEEASVFCCADEAALCAACDGRIHRANKLAGKHLRLSLLPPSSSLSAPLCDICQERRGFVFCQEDRAILCRDCDAPIHGANELTKKHNRYLLTGVRISSDAAPTSPAAANVLSPEDQAEVQTAAAAATSAAASTTTTTNTLSNSSSISDYLIKMLPGWHVEDLLVDDAAAAAAAAASSCSVEGFLQNYELQQYLQADDLGMAAAAEFPLWAPQVPQATLPYAVPAAVAGGAAGNYSQSFTQKELNHYYQQQQLGVKVGRDWWSDDSFTVPQISPPAPAPATRNNKRPRYPAAAEWCF